MTDGRVYFFNLAWSDSVLTYVGPDEQVREEEVVQWARLLCAGWNARQRARHCDHQWGEAYLMHEAYGPNVENRMCEKCGNDRLSWEQQQLEEALQ